MGNNSGIAGHRSDSCGLPAALSFLDELPHLHAAVHQLFEALADDDIDRHRLAELIEQCPALASRLVGLANSAYFRRRPKAIACISDSIFVIGFRTVRSLATASALQETFSGEHCPAFRPGQFWLHAVITAHAARELARKTTVQSLVPEEAYLAGLLHGIGLLALVHLFPQELDEILQQAGAGQAALANLLEQRFHASHRRTGAALLSRWHLPEQFSHVCEHHADTAYQGSDWLLCRLVAVARDWAGQVVHREQQPGFDPAGLNVLGIAPEEGEALTGSCMERMDSLLELSELIGGDKPVFCEPVVVESAAIELKDRLIDSIEALSSLSELAALDVKDTDESSLLRDALKVLMKNHHMERCSVFMLEDGMLVNLAGLSWGEVNAVCESGAMDGPEVQQFRPGEGLVGIAAETGELQHCRDCSADPRFIRPETLTEADAGPGSLISVPVCFRGGTLGVLNISHCEVSVFTEWDERFLSVFCNLLGQLITSGRLLRNLDHEIRQRTLELQVALERAESLSILDGLTGVHNRRYFISHFATLTEQCARYRYGMAVMMLDVDDFKNINDEFGHLEGDRVLKSIADVLVHCARGADIIARFGGEEFIIALQDTNCEGVNQVAGRIQDQIGELSCGTGGHQRSVTVSIGIACYGDAENMPVKTPEQWIQEADDALYRAKRSGKNRISVHVCDDPGRGT